jgi:hypothetical protein
MKKILLTVIALAATAAFASNSGGNGGGNGNGNGNGGGAPAGPVININDDSVQMTSAMHSSVKNKAEGSNTEARQNVSSNAGNVNINKDSTQITILKSSSVSWLLT